MVGGTGGFRVLRIDRQLPGDDEKAGRILARLSAGLPTAVSMGHVWPKIAELKLGSLGISRRGDAHLRGLLFEAATVILTRSSADSGLRRWGLKLDGSALRRPD